MKKKSLLLNMVTVIVLSIGLAGCGNSSGNEGSKRGAEASSVEKSTAVEETISESEEAELNEVPSGFTKGYDEAEFKKYNSPAEENGLGGTKIWIEGTMGSVFAVDETICVSIEQEDGDEWLVMLDTKEEKETYEEIEDHTVCIDGIYEGFSETYEQPAVTMNKLFDETTGDLLSSKSYSDYTGENVEKEKETKEEKKTEEKKAEKESTEKKEVKSDSATAGEKNALKTANSYLSFTAFSYSGLIEQLEYEGYSTEEATYAADNCGADWNEQAVKKSKDYLEFTAFSYTGLIEQLEYEGFTSEQATHGADNCGADWNEQAANQAKSYLEFMGFSREELIDQLLYEGFSQEQAEYGVAQNGL